jgi:hypothetical protein
VQVIARSVLEIHDKQSRHSVRASEKLVARRAEFSALNGSDGEIKALRVSATHDEIVQAITEFVSRANGNIVLDITSFPKRFSFPMVRRLLADANRSRVSNLIATYSIPITYPNGPLAENFNDWAQLPLFSGQYAAPPSSMLIIGVGFQALGLQEQLKGEPELPIKLLLPFPAPPAAFQRSWELLRQLKKNRNQDAFEVFRASATDAVDTFERIVKATDGGRMRADLAPFGPKPMSLGMCIFAALTDAQVFYTQPSVYHPDYSIGVSRNDGEPEVFAYALRINGRDIFGLP